MLTVDARLQVHVRIYVVARSLVKTFVNSVLKARLKRSLLSTR